MDLKQTALKSVQRAISIFKTDLEALPEEAFTQKFGDKVRTVADIVHEVNLVNDHIAMGFRGEEPFEWPDEGWITAPANQQSKSSVLAAFESSSTQIVHAIENLPDDGMESIVESEQGPTTLYGRCQFISIHLWYHSGQLNFIQTLLGDDAWHW